MAGKRRIFSSIRFKMMAGIIVFVALLMGGVNGVITGQVRETILDESLEKGRAVAKNLSLIAEEAILTRDDTSLFTALTKIVKESRGIVYAFVRNGKGTIIAHNDFRHVDSVYEEPRDGKDLPAEGGYRIVSLHGEKGLTYDISTRVGGGGDLGYVHVGIASSIIEDVVERTGRNILLITLAGILAGGFGAFILADYQMRPLLKLAEGVKSIGEGRFDHRIEEKREDEIGDLTDAFNEMAKGLQEREFIRMTFRKFVHRDVVDELLKNPEKIRIGGERRKVTILFTDIRGFTSLSEQRSPEEVINVVNEYFSTLLPIIDSNGGVLDKFIGDSMMIVFGIPERREDDAFRAVKAGLEMRDAILRLNERRRGEGKDPVTLGVGINTGNVVAGNVGSEERMEYTVLGDAVNVAARIEGLSKTGEVLVSEATYEEVRDRVSSSGEGEEVLLKGKSEPITVYRIDGLSPGMTGTV